MPLLNPTWFDSLANWLRPRCPLPIRRKRRLSVETLEGRAMLYAPVAVDDEYFLDEGQSLSVSSVESGVLGNDSDGDDDPLTTVLAITTTYGELTLDPDGTFDYVPYFADYYGTDQFGYWADAASESSNVAWVTLHISPINDAPAAADDSYELNEDQPLSVSVPGLLWNDSDPENDTLSPEVLTEPAHGTLDVATDGSFIYTPDSNYHGPDSFTYRANDSEDVSNVATVTITVNSVPDPPVAYDDYYTLDEDAELEFSVTQLLANDSNLEGGLLLAIIDTFPQHGDLTLAPDGGLVYVPDVNYHGIDSFTYHALSGSLQSEPATVTITVNSVNDVPVALDDTYIVPTDDTTGVNWISVEAPGILDNDSDPEGNSLTVAIVDLPTHGTLTASLDGSFYYEAFDEFTGTDFFTYRASDGIALSALAVVYLSVTSIDLEIFNGQGGDAIPYDKEFTVGAFTVANLNDTDGDGFSPGEYNDIVRDRDDTNGVVETANGHNEVDLMQLRVHRPGNYVAGTAVELIHDEGSVALWADSNKTTPVVLEEGKLILDEWAAGEAFKDFWIEATEVSGTIRDIKFRMKYQGAVDRVRATAVWVTMSHVEHDYESWDDLFVNGPFSEADALFKDNVKFRYGQAGLDDDEPAMFPKLLPGQSPHPTDITADMQRGGIRNVILFRWEILPNNVEDELSPFGDGPAVKFDPTRRKEARSWEQPTGMPLGLAESFAFLNERDFPNDDAHNADDSGPSPSGYLFSRDAVGRSEMAATLDLVRIRGNFEEFVRVRFDNLDFLGENEDGSRASDKYIWHARLNLVPGAGSSIVRSLNPRSADGSYALETEQNDIGPGHIELD